MESRRREFLVAAAGVGLGGLAGATATLPFRKVAAAPNAAPSKGQGDEPNSPPESLMLEHAIQERLLAIYEEAADRLLRPEDNQAAAVLRQAAALVRTLCEDFHQRLEEQFVFPHFEKHAELGHLVKTLKEQHAAGRVLTDTILQTLGAARSGPPPAARPGLARTCRRAVRIARPHMAREATELFQSLYDVAPPATLDEMSRHFEKQQEAVFGEDGFKDLLAQIAEIEKEFVQL
jgi:hemerythrin-like domain-containing protein